MVRLNSYPLGSIWSQQAHFGEMTPIYYAEALPGERWNGRARVKFMSDSLIKAALNRMWFDCFAFYVPFRLLNEDFPAWLAGDDGVTGVPTVNDTWQWNFEGALVGDAGTGHDANAAWQRYCYNYVFNEVFLSGEQSAGALTDTTPRIVLNRQRSLQNIMKTGLLPTVSQGSTVTDLKRAYGDHRQRRYEYWFDSARGNDYLEVLRRMGVEPGFEIADEPRLIGQYHAQGSFEAVVSTGDSQAGSPSGFWAGSVEFDFGSRLMPEHGIVAVYAVPRIEFPVGNMNVLPMAQKLDREFYYLPEYRDQSTHNSYRWSNRLVVPTAGGTGPALDYNYATPFFEDYRTPMSQMFATHGPGSPYDDNYALVADDGNISGSDDLRDYETAINRGDFWRSFTGVTGSCNIYVEIGGNRESPVPPRERNI